MMRPTRFINFSHLRHAACATRLIGRDGTRQLSTGPSSWLPNTFPTARAADTALASGGLFSSIALLDCVAPHIGLPLFHPAMLASGIIFFFGPEPPNPKGFLMGTLCSASASYEAVLLFSPHVDKVVAEGAAASFLLVWYKATGAIFPPAAALAGVLAASAAPATAVAAAPSMLGDPLGAIIPIASYVAFPWLAGHGIIYSCAWMLSGVRSRVRVALTQRQLASLHVARDDAFLRECFEKFDTSGDGAIDATELKVALRVTLGTDLSLDECAALVAAADTDGTETVCFDEFRAICRGEI